MADFILHIPTLPDLDLSVNQRRSRVWEAQWRDTTQERLSASLILKAVKDEWYRNGPIDAKWCDKFSPPVFLHWTLYFPKGMRARDWDNCVSAVKPWQDAMVDLKWLQRDSPKYVVGGSLTVVPSSPEGPSMRLTIQSL